MFQLKPQLVFTCRDNFEVMFGPSGPARACVSALACPTLFFSFCPFSTQRLHPYPPIREWKTTPVYEDFGSSMQSTWTDLCHSLLTEQNGFMLHDIAGSDSSIGHFKINSWTCGNAAQAAGERMTSLVRVTGKASSNQVCFRERSNINQREPLQSHTGWRIDALMRFQSNTM